VLEEEVDALSGLSTLPLPSSARPTLAMYVFLLLFYNILLFIVTRKKSERFITILLFVILVDYGSHPYHWLMFDRILQQLVLQGETSEDVDGAPLEINVKEIIQL